MPRTQPKIEEKIIPKPHFVIKVKIFSPYKGYPSGTKLFINVCSNPKVPKRAINGRENFDFDPNVIFPLISSNQWEIPILTSPQIRETVDKKHNKSILIDCVINDLYMNWCIINPELKTILVHWCIDAVEFQIGDNFIIDRDSLVLPKRISMGDPIDIPVDLEKLNSQYEELEKISVDAANNEPLSILEAKRFDEENQESLTLNIGNNDNNKRNGKKLIEEIEDLEPEKKTNQLTIESKKITNPEASIRSNKIKFVIDIHKLNENDTKMNHSYLLKIESELKDAKDYKVQYRSKDNVLVLSSTKEPISKLDFPLPNNVTGDDITTFFVTTENRLYVYIK